MARSNDPSQIEHADLREFAVHAARVAKLEDAIQCHRSTILGSNCNRADRDLYAVLDEDP